MRELVGWRYAGLELRWLDLCVWVYLFGFFESIERVWLGGCARREVEVKVREVGRIKIILYKIIILILNLIKLLKPSYLYLY